MLIKSLRTNSVETLGFFIIIIYVNRDGSRLISRIFRDGNRDNSNRNNRNNRIVRGLRKIVFGQDGLIFLQEESQRFFFLILLLANQSMTSSKTGTNTLKRVLHSKVRLLGSLRDPRKLRELTKFPWSLQDPFFILPKSPIAVANITNIWLRWEQMNPKIKKGRIHLHLASRN